MYVLDQVAKIVCKAAWGRMCTTINSSTKDYEWSLAHDQLSSTKPSVLSHFDSLPATNFDFVVATYYDYIDAKLPLRESYSETEMKERKATRALMTLQFVSKEGLGSKFKGTYDRLMKALALPKGAKEELGIVGDHGMDALGESERSIHQNQDEQQDEEDETLILKRRQEQFERQMLRTLYAEGTYHLIPSFLRALMYLKQNK